MQTVLIVIHLMVVIALVCVVLLQRSEGGALGIGGGGFMTGRGQANVLTRATAILAALFFLTSLGLTLLANWTGAPKSILQGVIPPATTSGPASAPAGKGDLLDHSRRWRSNGRRRKAPPRKHQAQR